MRTIDEHKVNPVNDQLNVRVTPADIEANIASEHYFSASDGDQHERARSIGNDKGDSYECLKSLTFCVLVLRNGFTVTGESACVSPENFDVVIGRKIARANAANKIGVLEGYLLKERLYQLQQPDAMADVASYLQEAHAAALDPSPDEPGKVTALLDQAIAALERAK